MKKKPICAILVGMVICGYAMTANGQSTELTSGDNHALLYARQLGFASHGIPTVRMRIADGLRDLKFTPKSDFAVMPSGIGGAVIALKGGQTYHVTQTKKAPGQYQYGMILDRGESPDDLRQAGNYCTEHHIETEIVPMGSVFALKGTVFDNRESILMTRLNEDINEAKKYTNIVLPDKIFHEHGEIYQELKAYPTSEITISDEIGNIKISHQNLIWFSFKEDGVVLHDIADESGKPGDFTMNAQMIITPDSRGDMAVVQQADVETILRGIVPSEIYASAPEGALRAQAIAARTTLMAQVGARHNADPYHLCNRQHCQVYRGLGGADKRTDEAIDKTRGEVLMSDNKLAQTYYSAHCGGFSAGSEETWGLPDKKYLVSRSDDEHEKTPSFKNDSEFMQWHSEKPMNYCMGAPAGQTSYRSTKHARWETRIDIKDIEKALNKAGQSVGVIKDIEVVERGASYRAVRIKIIGQKASYEIARELPIRRFFGGLKSALFAIKVEKNGDKAAGVTFYGAGFGHGVGMCQTGAIGMAQRGKSAHEILNHYFPWTVIKTIY